MTRLRRLKLDFFSLFSSNEPNFGICRSVTRPRCLQFSLLFLFFLIGTATSSICVPSTPNGKSATSKVPSKVTITAKSTLTILFSSVRSYSLPETEMKQKKKTLT